MAQTNILKVIVAVIAVVLIFTWFYKAPDSAVSAVTHKESSTPVASPSPDLSVEELGDVSMRFATLFWDVSEGGSSFGKHEKLYFLTNGKYEELKYANGRPGEPQKYAGPGLMKLYQREVNSENIVNYKSVAEMTLKGDPKKVVMFLSFNEEEVICKAVNISASNLPNGSVLFLNLSGVDCGGLIQDQSIKVASGESTIIKTVPNDKFELPIKVSTYSEKKKKWKNVTSIVTRIIQEKSYVVVFYLAGDRKSAYRLKIMRSLNLI